jgi:hypothetical protein
MFKKIDIFWSIYLAHRCFKFDVSIDDIIDVSKILRIPNSDVSFIQIGKKNKQDTALKVFRQSPGIYVSTYFIIIFISKT